MTPRSERTAGQVVHPARLLKARPLLSLTSLALAQLVLYGVAWAAGLNLSLAVFMALFAVQFGLYLAALAVIASRHLPLAGLALIGGAAVAFRLVAATAYPTLSSDMFRYIWDGRVQAHGVSPYAYPPAAAELAALRDAEIWPHINRKDAVTIYPPGAQLVFRLIGAAWPDTVWALKLVMAMADLATCALLVALLRALGRPPQLVLVYAWHPLAVYEIAGAGHMEALLWPCLALALLGALRGRPGLAGAALAAATLVKLFPVLLLPALWWRRSPRLPLAFAATMLLGLWPYRDAGLQVMTYYPTYLREQFNMGLVVIPGEALRLIGVADPYRIVQYLVLAALAGLALTHLLRPDGGRALVRCFTLIGVLLAGSQFVQPWYVLWLLPFLVVLWPWDTPSPAPPLSQATVRPTTWLGWLLFSGAVVSSYHFYSLGWYSLPVVALEYLALYVPLVLPATVRLAAWLGASPFRGPERRVRR